MIYLGAIVEIADATQKSTGNNLVNQMKVKLKIMWRKKTNNETVNNIVCP